MLEAARERQADGEQGRLNALQRPEASPVMCLIEISQSTTSLLLPSLPVASSRELCGGGGNDFSSVT